MATAKKRPVTFDHLKKKKPVEKKVTIFLDDEIVGELTQLRQQLERARLMQRALADREDDENKAKAAQEILDLEDEIEAVEKKARTHSVEMVFRSIGRKAYDELVLAHPPTDEDHEEMKKMEGEKAKAPYHGESFAPELIALSCVEPKMTVNQVQELFDEWNTAEITELFMAALEVNTTRRVAELGKSRGTTRVSGKS